MASVVRVGTTRGGRASTGGSASSAQSYPDTTSAYGSTRADSRGYNPANPYAFMGTKAEKSYKTSKGTRDWDGPQGISPALRPATTSVND